MTATTIAEIFVAEESVFVRERLVFVPHNKIDTVDLSVDVKIAIAPIATAELVQVPSQEIVSINGAVEGTCRPPRSNG